MLVAGGLILLTVISGILVKKILDKGLEESRNNYELIKSEYDKKAREIDSLTPANMRLEESLAETMELFDLTKDIRKILDEEKIFNTFKERIKSYIKITDCLFLKDESQLSQYQDYRVLPLAVEEKTLGYLVASGVPDSDLDKFNILAHQFSWGIKGVFLFKQLQELTITDSLTQVFNRRYLLERLNEELARSIRFNLNLSLLMIDIDHFKNYNDHYGHLVGDAILREIVKTLKENTRQIDFMGRYGGEELSIVLVETDKKEALIAAQRFRRAIESREFLIYDEKLKVTISIGISTFPEDGGGQGEIINRADEALYKAKQAGRNKVCAYGPK